MHTSSSYAKILGDTNFHTREIPRSGSKAEDGEEEKKRERERERAKVGENNGQATHGARKHAWRTQAAWAKKKKERKKERLNNGDNNGQATHGARKPPGPKERKTEQW